MSKKTDLASSLKDWGSKMAEATEVMRRRAREFAYGDDRAGAAVCNIVADGNAELADLLWEAASEMETASQHQRDNDWFRGRITSIMFDNGEAPDTDVVEAVRKMRSVLIQAKENCSLRSCAKCQNLHQINHVCYVCGHDDSLDEEGEETT